MSYNSNAGKTSYTVTNTSTVDYTFLFKIFEDINIDVFLTPVGQGADDLLDLLTLNVDYTVDINGDLGGFISLTNTPTVGDTIILVRDLAIDRIIEYTPNGGIYSFDLNQDQDYQTYMIADGVLESDRAIKLPISAVGVSTELPTPASDEYLRWNAAADALINDGTLPTAVEEALQSSYDSQASRLTSDSYATEPEDTFVNVFTSNGDGTYTSTPSTDYSSLHWSAKSVTGGNLSKWGSEASAMTSNSYAIQTVDVFVDVYTSNGDGTFTATPTTEYSALHYSAKVNDKFNEFTNIYYGALALEPTERPDTTPTQSGDIYFDTTSTTMRVFNGTGWQASASSVNGTSIRQFYIATAGQTVFNVTGDYDGGFADVYMNGRKLVNGVDVDVTSGTEFTLTIGALIGDILDFVGYGSFAVADTYTKAEIDQKVADSGSNTTDKFGYENNSVVSADYTITVGNNMVSAGDITINNGITVTVPDGSNWIIV